MFWLPYLLSVLVVSHATTTTQSTTKKTRTTTPYPEVELMHDPGKRTTTMTPYVNETNYKISDPKESPDYRLPEPPWVAWKDMFYREENRPYRVSPFWYQVSKFNKKNAKEYVFLSGCYCVTVFKRLTPLGGCAVITTRHALTTATSTELVLQRYRKKKTLENILGLWYDINPYLKNSSMYATPARIHYHPEYNKPSMTNRSHPLPCVMDLAVWAMTYRFLGTGKIGERSAIICQRGGSHQYEYAATTPRAYELLHIIGFQFVWIINRVPAPWYKYLVRVRLDYKQTQVCPKIGWGWFHCIPGDWARIGLDSGAALHIAFENRSWRIDGLIGLNSFSMKLRSLQTTHYFTVLDTHRVIDFLYAAYMGRPKYQYLDYRFFNTQWRAPIIKPWHYIKWNYKRGDQHQDYNPPFW